MPQDIRRINISLTGDSVAELEQLRELLEKQLKMRLSTAQVFKRLIKIALAELALDQQS
jgi:hypothetical protein